MTGGREAGDVRPRRRRIVLLVALGVVLGGVYLQRTLFWVWPHLSSSPGDFGYYDLAARAVLVGTSPFQSPYCDYPPLLPFAIAPFSALGSGGARFAFFFVSQGCLLGAAWILWLALGADASAGLIVALLFAFAGTVPANLALGQIQPLLLLLIVVAIRKLSTAPRWAAASLGLAAGLKIWPGLLLFSLICRKRRDAFAVGAAVAALLVLGPWLVLGALFPPPHLAVRKDYWLGTPASLNLSLPATVLRVVDLVKNPPGTSDVPVAWSIGNSPELFRLAPGLQLVSAGVSIVTLLVGLGLVVAARRDGPSPPARDVALVAALVSLFLAAAPIAWYHYQIFQLPGLALLGHEALGRRSLPALARWALLVFGLTEPDVMGAAFRWAGLGAIATTLLVGIVVVVLDGVLFALLLGRAGRLPDES